MSKKSSHKNLKLQVVFFQQKKKKKMYLRSEDDGAFLQEESEVAGEIDTSGKPPPGRHIKLRATLIRKGLEVKDCILEGNGVQCFAISNCTKFQNGDTMWSWLQWLLSVIALPISFFSVYFNGIAQSQKQQEQYHLIEKEKNQTTKTSHLISLRRVLTNRKIIQLSIDQVIIYTYI